MVPRVRGSLYNGHTQVNCNGVFFCHTGNAYAMVHIESQADVDKFESKCSYPYLLTTKGLNSRTVLAVQITITDCIDSHSV